MPASRRSFERRLGPLVAFAAQLPRAVPFVVAVGLVVGGLLAGGGLGAVLLVLLAGVLVVLLVLAWPALAPQARGLRVAVVAVVLVRAATFLL